MSPLRTAKTGPVHRAVRAMRSSFVSPSASSAVWTIRSASERSPRLNIRLPRIVLAVAKVTVSTVA
jgi:hypothetical protein